jgi:SPP1 gp7 family putative phage head morphogenesis protein
MKTPKILYTNKQIESLFKGIFAGGIDLYNLPKNLYNQTAKVLNSAVEIGFGEVDNALLKELKNNIYMFSAAKTFRQVKEMQSMLYEDNKKLDYKVFRDRVKSTYSKFNEAYLESEYVTALTSANNALNYREAIADKKLFTQLRYVAINDAYTSEICKRLSGTVANTDDKIWHTCSPPNHFNCRCHLEKIDKYEELKPDSASKLSEVKEFAESKMQPVFKNNSGITNKIFDKSHPYFSVPKKYNTLAKRNFDLKMPK